MEDKPRDIYNAIESYKRRKGEIYNDPCILKINKQLILEWLQIKEKELKNRKGREYEDEIRWSKTMTKYCYLLQTFGGWVKKPLNKFTEEDIEQIYNDLEDGKIKTRKGTSYARSSRKDYYNKIFKSDFFKFLGLKEKAQDIIKLESGHDEQVKFFSKEDLDKMVNFTHSLKYRFLYLLLFDTGLRIGTALNLRKNDFEKRFNSQTKQDYYLVHIKSKYTKSKRDRSVSLWLEETNRLAPIFLGTVKDNDLIFNMSYNAVRTTLSKMCSKLQIRTKPDNKSVSIHDFRRSCATYWLSKKVNIDAVRARLGHKPSSTAIDRYVNYLGLNDSQTVQEIQQSTYKEMMGEYKEIREQLLVMQENYKSLEQDIQQFKQKMQEPNQLFNVLFHDEEFHRLIERKIKNKQL